MKDARSARLTFLVFTFIALATVALADDKCNVSTGDFTAVAPANCTSPVGICTLGTLKGQFPSTYAFTADTLAPAYDPASPNKFVYTGHSVITTPSGDQMYGSDSGFLYMEPDGHAPFVTTVKIVGGTGAYAHAKGQFVAPGVLHLSDGTTVGTYTAYICSDSEKD